MARWEQYDFYPKESVKWLKPAHNPTGLLVQELLKMKFCVKKRK